MKRSFYTDSKELRRLLSFIYLWLGDEYGLGI